MVPDSDFIEAFEKCTYYSEVAAALGVHIKTVISRAKKLGIVRVGLNGGGKKEQFNLQDILGGKHPQYPTYKLKLRLIEAGLLIKRCHLCDISEWRNLPIVLELDHIDGNNTNHALVNLRLLCPNCHSQTTTFKSKNKKLRRVARQSAS